MKTLDMVHVASYATAAHAGQLRKYTGAPYITHPERVALAVGALPGACPAMVAAAWLHDVVEDCGVKIEHIESLFGIVVASLVDELTNPSKGSKASRAERKAQDRAHIKAASRTARIIKLVDRIDNLGEFDPAQDLAFGRLYGYESLELVAALRGTHNELESQLRAAATKLLDMTDKRRKTYTGI